MRFQNASLFTGDGFSAGSFEVQDGRFVNVTVDRNGSCRPDTAAAVKMTSPGAEAVDLQGALVLPGLIDLHGHGNSGRDFSSCDLDGLREMAAFLGKNGITSFAPASMTMSWEQIRTSHSHAARLFQLQKKGTQGRSRIVGINMEGPFFSYGKRGAQDPVWLKAPDFPAFQSLYEECGGLIKLVDIAPELPGAMEFIRQASRLCTVSVAHTEADYDTVLAAFQQGASQMTHLFNGMNGVHHRAPGPVCAAMDTPGIFVELICDGIHIAPPVIRMVFTLFPERVILISDALSCCGMPDGTYELGGQKISLKDRHATLPDGTLAGSACTLFDMLQRTVSFGIPLTAAITAATRNPAIQLGIYEEVGSIAEGKKADFLICSESLQLMAVYIDGEKVR